MKYWLSPRNFPRAQAIFHRIPRHGSYKSHFTYMFIRSGPMGYLWTLGEGGVMFKPPWIHGTSVVFSHPYKETTVIKVLF